MFIKTPESERFQALGLRSKRKIIEVLDQVGKSNLSRDRKRVALPPGKRISKTGKEYWETRKNRSDALNKKT